MQIEFTVSIEEWEAAWALVATIDEDETSRFGYLHLSSLNGVRRWLTYGTHRATYLIAESATSDFEVAISPWIFTAGRIAAATTNEVEIRIAGREGGLMTVGVRGPGGEFHVEVPSIDFPGIDRRVLAEDRVGASTTIEAGVLSNFVFSVSGTRDKSYLGELPRNHVSFGIGGGRFSIRSTTPSIGDMYATIASGPCEGDISIEVSGHEVCAALRLFDPEATIRVLLPRWVGDSLMLTDGTLTALVWPLQPEFVRAQEKVEETIKEVCGPLALRRDQDGDYPLQRDLVPIYARYVSDSYPYRLQVFAVLLNDIQSNPELMVELNDLNTNLAFTRLFHVNNQVLAEADLVAETLDPEELSTVIRRIHRLAVEVTPTLSAVFGGTLVENPEVARKDGYRSAILEVETFPGTLVALNGPEAERDWQFPESVFVITGWSPQGVDLGETAHQKANRTIAATIAEIGGRFLHGHGRSPSGDHSEPSLFAWDISAADAIEIGRRADQESIFQVTADEVVLLSCVDDGRQSWSRLPS